MSEADDKKNETYWKIIQSKVQQQRIEKLFDILRKQGVEPILIKGWAAARNYPQPYERLSADVDIAVDPELYKECQIILRQQSISGVDLHCGLRHLDTVSWKNLFQNSQSVKLNNTQIRILCPEDHLRILCVHWLTDGGVSKDRLFDIFYAVENRPPDFDWNKFLDPVDEIRREWLLCVIKLAVKYLDLNILETPLQDLDQHIPVWVIETIESEWQNEVSLKPLHYCLNDRKEFFRQLKKRFPPNPIQATIEMNGVFDDTSRITYQLKSFLYRIKPAATRIYKAALSNHLNNSIQNEQSKIR